MLYLGTRGEVLFFHIYQLMQRRPHQVVGLITSEQPYKTACAYLPPICLACDRRALVSSSLLAHATRRTRLGVYHTSSSICSSKALGTTLLPASSPRPLRESAAFLMGAQAKKLPVIQPVSQESSCLM